MTLEDIWRQRSDEELIAAAAQLTDYTEDARSVIQAEIRKRGLSTDSRRAMENGPKRKRRPRFFRGPINSIDHADYIIRSASQFFYALAAIQMLIIVVLLGGVLGRIQSGGGLIDVVVYALGGFFLSRTKRSGVAIFLIFWTALVFILTLVARTQMSGGGGNIVLGVLALWSALRGYKATVYLRSPGRTTSSGEEEDQLRGEAKVEAEVARLLKERENRNPNP